MTENHIPFFSFYEPEEGISIRYGFFESESPEKKGSVILLSGRSEFMEKYFETIRDLNHRGFDVYSKDWRGQGLSTRETGDRRKGFINTFEDYILDLEFFIYQIVLKEAKGPLYLLSHSMGGNISLRFLKNHQDVFKKAVFVSPMFQINTAPFPQAVAQFCTKVAVWAGLKTFFAALNGDYSSMKHDFEGNRLTNDPERFVVDRKAISKNPDLAVGGVTNGWAYAAFESMRTITGNGFAENINTPCLFAAGGEDRVVHAEAIKAVSGKMPDSQCMLFPEARHEILFEKDDIRDRFWDAFDNFI